MRERRLDFLSMLGLTGALFFVVCLYTSPADLVPDVAVLHPALLSAALMLGGMMLSRLMRGVRLRLGGSIGLNMALLFSFAALSMLWAYDPSLAFGFTLGGVKLMAAFVGIATTLRMPRHIRWAMLVAVLASMIPGWGTISRYRQGIGLVEGYRGTWIGLLANPNQLAMVMAVTVPWTVFLQKKVSLFLRPFLVIALGLEVGAIVATHSRGGMLGLAAAMTATAFLSVRKGRALGMLAAAGVAVVILAPQTFWARAQTIEAYNQDASALGRIQSWRTGLTALRDSPLLGVGANNYVLTWDVYAHRNVREKSYAAHNMWMEVLVELGLIGITLFAIMFVLILRGLWRARRDPEVGGEARALISSLIALVICGSTGGYAFNWFFYMVLGMAGAVIGFARESNAEGEAHALELAVA